MGKRKDKTESLVGRLVFVRVRPFHNGREGLPDLDPVYIELIRLRMDVHIRGEPGTKGPEYRSIDLGDMIKSPLRYRESLPLSRTVIEIDRGREVLEAPIGIEDVSRVGRQESREREE